MRLKSVTQGFVAAAAVACMAGTAQAGADTPINVVDNPSALDFGIDNVALFDGDAKDADKAGVDALTGFAYLPPGAPLDIVGGWATNTLADDDIAALVWLYQDPNDQKANNNNYKIKQKEAVAWSLVIFDSSDAFLDGVPVCVSDLIELDTCKGDANIKEKGPDGKFKVDCKDVNPNTIGALLNADGNFGCVDFEGIDDYQTNEQLSAVISTFVDDKNRIKYQVKDKDGVVRDLDADPFDLLCQILDSFGYDVCGDI